MKRLPAFAATLSATCAASCLLIAAPAQASRAETLRAPVMQPAKPWLRGIEPGTTGSIEGPTAASGRPPCPPDRKIGTGAGFCVIN